MAACRGTKARGWGATDSLACFPYCWFAGIAEVAAVCHTVWEDTAVWWRMSIKVLAWKTVLSCSFLLFFLLFTFIHSLCHAAVAIMAVTSVSFHQASPSLLQRPFFSPFSAVYYRLLSPLPFHISICLSNLFSTSFSTFFFGSSSPGLGWKCCSFKPNATGEGCLLICLPYTWIKEQHCIYCIVHTKQSGFKAVPFIPKTQTTYRLYCSIIIFWFSFVKK